MRGRRGWPTIWRRRSVTIEERRFRELSTQRERACADLPWCCRQAIITFYEDAAEYECAFCGAVWVEVPGADGS